MWGWEEEGQWCPGVAARLPVVSVDALGEGQFRGGPLKHSNQGDFQALQDGDSGKHHCWPVSSLKEAPHPCSPSQFSF